MAQVGQSEPAALDHVTGVPQPSPGPQQRAQDAVGWVQPAVGGR